MVANKYEIGLRADETRKKARRSFFFFSNFPFSSLRFPRNPLDPSGLRKPGCPAPPACTRSELPRRIPPQGSAAQSWPQLGGRSELDFCFCSARSLGTAHRGQQTSTSLASRWGRDQDYVLHRIGGAGGVVSRGEDPGSRVSPAGQALSACFAPPLCGGRARPPRPPRIAVSRARPGIWALERLLRRWVIL